MKTNCYCINNKIEDKHSCKHFNYDNECNLDIPAKGYCESDDMQNKRCEKQCKECKSDPLNTPQIGDVVQWQYTHHLNSRSTTEIVKTGILIRIGKTKKKFLADSQKKIGIVKFQGNKNPSRIIFHTLFKKF